MATIDRIANINSFTQEFGFETRRFETARLDDLEAVNEIEEESICLEVGCFNLRALSLEDKWGWGRIVNYAVPQSIDQLTDREIAELFRDIIVSKQNILLRDSQARPLGDHTYSADRVEIKVDADGEMSPGMLFFISGHADPEVVREDTLPHGLKWTPFLNR